MKPLCTDGGFIVLNLENDRTKSLIAPSLSSSVSTTDTDNTLVGPFASYRGATALVQDAVDAGVTTMEQVQTDVTDEAYRVMIKYVTPTLTIPVVKSIHRLHSGVVSSIYSTVRYANYGTGETLKCTFQTIDSIDCMCKKMFRYVGYSTEQ